MGPPTGEVGTLLDDVNKQLYQEIVGSAIVGSPLYYRCVRAGALPSL